jgi:CubicO group peptidase (beta-lactamase class C family)
LWLQRFRVISQVNPVKFKESTTSEGKPSEWTGQDLYLCQAKIQNIDDTIIQTQQEKQIRSMKSILSVMDRGRKMEMRKAMLLLFLVVTLILPACSTKPPLHPAQPVVWPTQGWQKSAPEEQGFDSDKLATALQTIQRNSINIHSLMIIRNDKVILDAYFYPYDGKTVHELASVTKSVLTTVVGIAADQGKLRLGSPMVSFFRDRKIANSSILKSLITVRDLASMSSGLDCTSDNEEQTMNEMGQSPDWVQFTIDLKAVYIPGRHYEYCSPGMHVLSAIIQEATGISTSEFARENLFEPLGISDFIWEEDPQGYSDGWAGLYLHPRDLAKIGYLMLHQGQWDGRQIVSSKWVEEASKLQKKTGQGSDYGYGWWIPKPAQFVEFVADGRGGQYIHVIPALNMVIVTTGGGFDWNEIVPLILPAMVDTANSLPANQTGVDHLNVALAAIALPTAPKTVTPLPELAETISGRTYAFEFSPLDIKTLQLEFKSPTEAHLIATFYNQPDEDLFIPLNGVYRMYPIGEHGLPMGLRGAWIDSQTFLFEYDEIANREAYSLKITFKGDQVSIHAQERTHVAGLDLVGTLQSP